KLSSMEPLLARVKAVRKRVALSGLLSTPGLRNEKSAKNRTNSPAGMACLERKMEVNDSVDQQ
ncbi:MAG: hypothetical protein ACYCOU_04835, partial [Sulfobacillus sp.]